MATLNFRVKHAAQKKAKIYMVLSVKRGSVFEAKLPCEIAISDWDNSRKYPKQNSKENEILKTALISLENDIRKKLESAILNKDAITKDWFKYQVNDFFNPTAAIENDRIVNHVQLMIDNASTRRVKGRDSLGISKSRINGYTNFKKVILAYEEYKRKRITFLDVDSRFVDDFTNYLINKKKYSRNYAGKQLSNLKTVSVDADRLQIPVNRYIFHVYGFKESNTDRRIITLTRDELKRIEQKTMSTEMLDNAKKWLLIGCEIGQRGEDMLSIDWSQLYIKENYNLIDVYQSKTKKWVTIPLLTPSVLEIVKNDPPHKISLTKLNSYIKRVCEEAEIDTPVEGKKLLGGGSDRRAHAAKLPKYSLITTHCFRRTFVTLNDENIDRQSVMEISGHSRESSYLFYINKHVDKSEKALSFARQKTNVMKEND